MHGCQVQNEDMVAGRMGLLRDYLESWSPRSQWWWYTILGISSYSTQYKGRLHHQHEPPTNHWFRPGKVTMCIPFLVFVVVHCWWKRRWFLRKIPEIGIWELFSQKSRLVVHFFFGGGLYRYNILYHVFTHMIYLMMVSFSNPRCRSNPSCPSSYWRNVLHHERLMILPPKLAYPLNKIWLEEYFSFEIVPIEVTC